jgi:UDP-2,3-diacylglucosamine hydrolase
VDALSDVHLQSSDRETFDAWRRQMQETEADAVLLLGDIFEVWVGDDAAAPGSFEAECAAVLREAASRRPVFFLHGNRDFLVGELFLRDHGATLLQDPCRFEFGARTWLLSHGDALCTDDLRYMAFREESRAPQWQASFLALPLGARRDIARKMRLQSESIQESTTVHADIDAMEARRWLLSANASVLVHGHTHRPGEHGLGDGLSRIVSSDWDLHAAPPRAEVLELTRSGECRRRTLA